MTRKDFISELLRYGDDETPVEVFDTRKYCCRAGVVYPVLVDNRLLRIVCDPCGCTPRPEVDA